MNLTKQALKSILTDALATGKTLDGLMLSLFKEWASGPVSNPTVSDVVECDFSGYAAAALTTTGVDEFTSDGSVGTTFQADFAGTSPTPTIHNSVLGYFVTDTGGTNLRLLRVFDNPAMMGGLGSVLNISDRVPFTYGEIGGDNPVIN